MYDLAVVRQSRTDVAKPSKNAVRAECGVQKRIVLQSVQKRQNQGPRWKPGRQFIDHPREIVGLTRQDRHVRIRIDAVEQVISRRGPVIDKRAAYPQAVPFDLARPVRADRKADIVARLNEAAAEIAADAPAPTNMSFIIHSDEIKPISLNILQ
jgi:hypothetical protein